MAQARRLPWMPDFLPMPPLPRPEEDRAAHQNEPSGYGALVDSEVSREQLAYEQARARGLPEGLDPVSMGYPDMGNPQALDMSPEHPGAPDPNRVPWATHPLERLPFDDATLAEIVSIYRDAPGADRARLLDLARGLRTTTPMVSGSTRSILDLLDLPLRHCGVVFTNQRQRVLDQLAEMLIRVLSDVIGGPWTVPQQDRIVHGLSDAAMAFLDQQVPYNTRSVAPEVRRVCQAIVEREVNRHQVERTWPVIRPIPAMEDFIDEVHGAMAAKQKAWRDKNGKPHEPRPQPPPNAYAHILDD